MTEVVRAETDADFLALVPRLAGFTSRNSVVCAMFDGSRAASAFRIDLPTRGRDADYRAVADALISLARRSPHIDRVVPVIYTDSPFEGEHGIPWFDLAMFAARRIHRSGLHLTGFFCVAADGWGDYFEQSPRTRHPLSDILRSPFAATDVRDVEEWGSLPERDSEESEALSDAIAALTELPDALDWVELCLGRQPGRDELANLVALAQSPAHRDTMMLQIAFGPIVGEAVAERNAHFLRLQEGTGLSMDEVVIREIAAGREGFDDEFDALLWGQGRIRPDPERMERAIRFLAWAAAHVEPEFAPPLLCMLAWLAWARGLPTVAGEYLAQARRIDSSYGMTEVLSALLRTRQIPDWAFPS